jgi:hypothetical protein
MFLAGMQTVALVADGVTTRTNVTQYGFVEQDSIDRAFIGARPTWERMAPAGLLQIAVGTYIAERMHHSKHKWERKIWWVPQVVGISWNTSESIYNVESRP